MNRRVHYLHEEWEVGPTGGGHGVGSGHIPSITNWGMSFRCLSNPNKGPYYGHLHTPDPNQATEEALIEILNRAIILEALEDPQWDWRTVEGISEGTGLPEQEIIRFIKSSPNELIRSRTPDEHGRALFTTRQHYSKKRSFLDTFRST